MEAFYIMVSLMLINVHRANSLECFSCINIDDANNCQNTTTCRNEQSCYMEFKHDSVSTTFRLGCKNNQMCGHPSSISNNLIGRGLEDRQTHECAECCSSDNCNKNLCEHLKPSACIDDTKADCAWLNTIVNLCQDIHHAKTICAKFCGLCPLVDGSWTEWSQWTICDVSCDKGIQIRRRTCTNPAPAYGGLNCTGQDKEVKSCNMPLCPVHGGWSMWGQWETCSVTCDAGIQRRHRNCSNPYPDRFGDHCFGDGMDDRICLPGPCTNGGWSSWDVWSSCSTTCDGGIKSRTRACNNPNPSFTGKSCKGESLSVTSCNVNPCPIPSVIFRSKDVTQMAMAVGNKLVFRTTTSNIGHGYNNSTGIFTAPVPGTYQFSAHICIHTYSEFGLAFISDDQEIHRDFITGANNFYHCDTSTATVQLRKDSQVYLKCTYAGKLFENGDYWNTFSGSILHL